MAQQGKAQSRARTWPVGGARQAWGVARPRREFVIATRLSQWAAQEAAAGRLLPWLAVAYGIGIVFYFTAEREPAWWAATTLAVSCAICAALLRRYLVASVLALFLFAIASGFAVATVKTALINHPILRFPGIMAQTPQKTSISLARPEPRDICGDPVRRDLMLGGLQLDSPGAHFAMELSL